MPDPEEKAIPENKRTDLRPLLEHWYFAKETAFRVLDMLAAVHEEYKNLGMDKFFYPGAAPVFNRRVLAEKVPLDQRSDQTPLKFEFTYTVLFEELRKARDEEDKDRQDNFRKKLKELYEVVARWAKKKGENGRTTLESISDQIWRDFLVVLGTHLSPRERPLLKTFVEDLTPKLTKILENESKLDDVCLKEVFECLCRLYLIYSRTPFEGRGVGYLTENYFEEVKKLSGCSDTLGYVVSLSGNQLNMFVRRIDLIKTDGDAKPNITDVTQSEIVQPEIEVFPKFSSSYKEIYLSLFDLFYFSSREPEEDLEEEHLAVPIYGRYDYSFDFEAKQVRAVETSGVFLGWIFQRLQLGVWKDLSNIDNLNKIFQWRRSLNRFADAYLEGEAEWALSQPWEDVEKPEENIVTAEDFVCEFIHYCTGWFGLKDQDEEARREQRLPEEYFGFRATNGTFVTEENYEPAEVKARDVSELWVNLALSPEWEGVAGANPGILKLAKRRGTALPNDYGGLRKYGRAMAQFVRKFYAGAGLLHMKRHLGATEAAQQHHRMMAHEMKKITNLIRGSTCAPVLDEIRRFFFALSTSETQNLFWAEIEENFPRHFLDANCLQAFILVHARIAYRLGRLTELVEKGDLRDETIVAEELAEAERDADECLHVPPEFSKIVLAPLAKNKLSSDDRRRAFFGMAMISLLRNIRHHVNIFLKDHPERRRQGCIIVKTTPAEQSIQFRNLADSNLHKGQKSYGTPEVLRYYAAIYRPDAVHLADIRSESADQFAWVISSLPLPERFLKTIK